jgi:hypothetical protein
MESFLLMNAYYYFVGGDFWKYNYLTLSSQEKESWERIKYHPGK